MAEGKGSEHSSRARIPELPAEKGAQGIREVCLCFTSSIVNLASPARVK